METVNTPPRTAQKWATPAAVRHRTTDGVSAVSRSACPGRMPKHPLSSSARTATTSSLSTRTVAGVVMVGDADADNRAAIEEYGKVAILGQMPWFDEMAGRRPAPQELSDWAVAHLDSANKLTEFLT